MSFYRTSVRYNGSRAVLCSSCVSYQMASFCAYPAWYIFPRWRRSRAPTGPPLGRLIYRAPFRPTVRSFLFVSRCPLLFPPRFLSPYVRSRASRSSSRHAVSSGVSFHASRCVVSSVLPSCRLACSSRRFGLSSRMGVVSFCCSLVLVSPVVAVLSCVLMPSRFYLGISSRLCVLSVRLVGSSCPRPVISSSLLTRWRLVSVLMLGSRVRAVSFCCSLVSHSFHSSSFVRPGFYEAGLGASWPWVGGGLLSSSHPSAHCSRSLFSHSLRDDYGEGWIWSAVSCCSSLVHCLFMSHRSSHPIGPSLSLRSNPLTHEARKRTRRRRRRWRTGNRTRRPYETKRREARRDEDGAETIHGEQASNKTTDETKKTRDARTRRPYDENERTTTKGNEAGLLYSKHHDTNEMRRTGIPFTFRPTPSPLALPHQTASYVPPPPGVG